jgi:SpoVK/Ycf46/Vps4 family AAA+-type ATPase
LHGIWYIYTMERNKLDEIYTEIIKIIEGGLKKEPAKVMHYAKKLVEKLHADGENHLAKGIENLLKNKAISTLTMEQLLTTAPVDSETRLSTVDVFNPAEENIQIILQENIENKVNDFIKIILHKDRFMKLGITAQNTLLIFGMPGVGKTTIAKYISLKTGLPLVTARLDAVVSSLLGNTSKNIRRIFEYADSKPCILFLDEFDAIAKARDDQHEMGELKRVINSLLQNIDAFTQNNILIAATNHPELLDKAIWRRFNTVIEVGPPSPDAIEKLINLYLAGYKTDLQEDRKKFENLIRLFSKKTPSDIRSIITNAITKSVINEEKNVSVEDLFIENFNFDTHGRFKNEELVKYLNDNGVPQLQIADLLDLSVRQIRNNLKDK